MTQAAYRPDVFRQLTYHDLAPAFAAGTDTPRAFLERCLETIAAREPTVQAWVATNPEGAREAADASTARWKAGRTLSPVDGMPIGIKDLIETRDMPTQMGCEAYRGNFPKRDSAMIRALRDAGAVILGKTVTTELGQGHPGPTTNPFHPRHTPGGSSSGSAAAVGARMVPAAIGTQVGGSIIRPASYCGNVALKPTQGAINRGERQGLSQSTAGVHAGSIQDMWLVAMAIAMRAGGDPGSPALFGPESPPPASKPARLIVMEAEGWALLDDASRQAFRAVLDSLRAAGVQILTRADAPAIDAFERVIADAKAVTNDLGSFETRWSQQNLIESHPDGVSQRFLNRHARGMAMTLDDYRARLLQREAMRRALAELAPLADALIAPSSPGPAPIWEGDKPGEPLAPRPTGDIAYNAATSALGVPCVTVPKMAVGGLPMGIQVIGHPHMDARTTGFARWMLEELPPAIA
ncbi:amidase [Roseomonas sp. SSH11]|uniref:Amidase n=1 Tax=Pararoseomonas baculiformis TaxID=2820812 RepID=A0ABS4A9G2_9PROT|nr:amidase [Pararoseomonas baculiformis]MBP0443644.1 amidase [Pararoseomonas baculiformis]